MGYRTYIGTIPKLDYNKIKSLTLQGLREKYPDGISDFDDPMGDGEPHWYKGAYEFCETLYEFGKYDGFNPPKGSMLPFFKKKDVKEIYEEDHDFHVVNEKFLEYVIEEYSERVRKYYYELLSPFVTEEGKDKSEFLKNMERKYDRESFGPYFIADLSKVTEQENRRLIEIFTHVGDMAREWGVNAWLKDMRPFSLDKDNDSLVRSWKYEYVIFDLVRVYKTFDWNKNVMVYYGY